MTNLEIVNRALHFIGEPAALSMADTARGAARAIAVYSTCRDEVLRLAFWTSCFRRERPYCTSEQATPWTASHRYEIGERCTNDTAKTYEVTTAGTSAAATGPTGTGSAITDGSVIWQYIEASTVTNNWCHAALTVYAVGDLVSWDTGKVYVCITAGTTGAASPPTGTTTDITDGTVHWAYYATIRGNRTVYAYEYVIPYDCLRVLKVPNLATAKESDQGVQYSVEGRFLYTDQADTWMKYVYRADPSEWDTLLQGTVAFRIAAEIALDVTGQQAIMKNAFDALNSQYAAGRLVAMAEAQEGTPEEPRWEDV